MNLDKYKISESQGNIETHEVFLDTLAHVKEQDLGISEKKLEVKINEKIIYAIFIVFFLMVAVLFSKTMYLQIWEGKNFFTLSENNKGTVSLIHPERGIIYDSHLEKLVLNAPAYDLVCDKKDMMGSNKEPMPEIQLLASILGKDYSEVENKILESGNGNVIVAENLDQKTLLVLEAKIADELTNCYIDKNTVRNYVLGPALAHVLGYNGRISKEELSMYATSDGSSRQYSLTDYVGKSGLEKSYEEELRGVSGKMSIARTAVGIEKGNTVLSEPEAGHSLVLNIDSKLQETAYIALEKSIKNVGAKKGAAVAVNPKTGAILALVSYPSYDNNIFSQTISKEDYNKLQNSSLQPFFNRAISSQYPVGSTIKPFLAAGALEENIISKDKLINDTGYISVTSKYDPNVVYTFSGVRPHGWVDMIKAIAVSSNIYFFTVGGGYKDQEGLGPSRIKKYLDLFGWEQKTGIDLPGEFKGFVPGPAWKQATKNEPWWDGDTYNLSIGQSDLQVTPLHVAMAYSAIANHGTLYKPQIVNRIISGSPENPEVIKTFQPEVVATNIIDDKNLEVSREGMLDGVRKDYGSSHLLNDLPVQVAGKTGTVETNKVGYYNTWSSSFAPYDNPEIVFVVTIESVNGFQSASLPVAHEVLQYYFSKK